MTTQLIDLWTEARTRFSNLYKKPTFQVVDLEGCLIPKRLSPLPSSFLLNLHKTATKKDL